MTEAYSEGPFERGIARAEGEKAFYERVNTKSRIALVDFLDGYHQAKTGRVLRVRAPETSAEAGANLPSVTKASRSLLRLPRLSVSMPHVSVATIALGAAIVGVGTPAASFVAPAFTDAVVSTVLKVMPKAIYEEVAANADCALVTPIKDRSGETVTFIRRSGCGATTYISAPVSEDGVSKLVPALDAIEGKISGPGVIVNVSLPGLARALASGGKVGGTNYLQSSIEVASGKPNGLSYREKFWLEFVVGAGFTANRLTTETERRTFAVQNLQCAIGAAGSAFGPGLAGDFCASIVGRAHLAEINTGEACFISATMVSPLRVPGIDQDTNSYEVQYSAIKLRAKEKCAPKLAGAMRNAVEKQIDAIEVPRPEAIIGSVMGMEKALPFAGRLFDELGVKVDGKPLTTTLNAAAQRAVVAKAISFGDKIAGLLQQPLCWSETCGNNRVDIAVAALEVRDGVPEFLAAYESRRGLLAGPTDGLPHRSVGSLTKGLLVPLLVEAGIGQVCRRNWGSLHDSDGFAGGACEDPANFLSLADALARSSNLAIVDGLRKIDGAKFRAYLRMNGYAVHGDLNDAQLIRSTITGDNVAIAPTMLIRNYAGLTFAPTGATLPTIVADGPMQSRIVFNDIFRPDALYRTREVLSAPLNRPHGTLLGIDRVLAQLGCRDVFGKSGTTDSVDASRYRDKLVIVGGTCNGRKIIAFGLVGSPDIRVPVGNVTTSQIARLATDAISISLKEGKRK